MRERIRYSLELNGLRRDGTELPIEISLSMLQLEGSVMVMSAIRDISERKRFQDELRRKNIELEQASRAKDRFLATMSHELRTPLNEIIGFTGTMLMGLAGPLTPDQERQLRTVQSSGRHLLSLINDLLDVARIESGKVELALAEVSCSALVEDVTATLRPLAENKGVVLRMEQPPSAVTVQSNERALNQILLNLVNNAIKFTDAGAVVVRLREHDDDGERGVAVSVTDTGPGIRKDDQARRFQAFTQLDAGDTRRHEGTGLGLHLSQKLAGLLGAWITCESEPGQGSCFTLHIRRAH
jgi:signal transduction histidine kinase